jgi:hypothetical protein
MFPNTRRPSPSPSVSSIASPSSITSDIARPDIQGMIEVAPRIAGDKTLTISTAWVENQKQEKRLDAYQKRMLGYALDAMEGKSNALNPAAHDKGGYFEFTRPAGPRKHVVFAVTYTRDPNKNEELGHIGVMNKETQSTIVEIGDAHLHVGSTDEDTGAASTIATSSRPSSNAGVDTTPPVRQHSADAIQSLLARQSAPPSPMQLEDDSSSDGRSMQQSAEVVAGQKRGRSSSAGAARLVDGQRPASRSASGSRRLSIHNDTPPADADSLVPGFDFPASPHETSPAAGALPGSPGTAANSIDVSIPSMIDLTRATPGPSTGTRRPASPADEMEAPSIKRQPVKQEDKKAFEKKRLACMSELVKYFNDSDLASVPRAVGIELLVQRAEACGAPQTARERLSRACEAWLNHSKAAIADILDDDPFFFNANGEPMQAEMIGYIRSTRCDGVQPLPIRPSEEIVRANMQAEDRFKKQLTRNLGLDQDASIKEIGRKSSSQLLFFQMATAFTRWTSENSVNLTELSRDALNTLRGQFATAPLFDGSEGRDSSHKNRRDGVKPFTDFLAAEYVARRRAAVDDAPAAAPPGSNPA